MDYKIIFEESSPIISQYQILYVGVNLWIKTQWVVFLSTASYLFGTKFTNNANQQCG
jgi:hypothetical protein